ncbi:conserved hypothetical protein, membrane or secreted [Candidatus Desulfofervidus auxilii]|uniref:DUF3568 family protein n=1 Tax=Desulfofervidus auxilii TaxID=1621989 RepID=A0A7U4TIW1_DESA2|nr:DUF3568 family protein [Candidatus Desulfofervidus auxilii]AMM41800.1 conserved hypothetical protein, membrane or secreted [Candidatus Desulfofervidus auxilii]
MRFLKYTMVSFLFFICGCGFLIGAGVGGGAGLAGYKFLEGKLEIEYIAPYERVWQATKLALKDTGIRIERMEKDAINAEIKARKADGKVVTIKIKNKASGMTIVSIRVGIFGDENASLIIKKAIDKRLGIRSKN